MYRTLSKEEKIRGVNFYVRGKNQVSDMVLSVVRSKQEVQ